MSQGRASGQGGSRGDPPRVLLVGYNGATNTGSESRLLSIIDDVRAVMGPNAHITIPTLNPPNLCRYIEETPDLSIARVPSIYFGALKRLVRQHDLVLLVEGSCYMDTWTSALLWAFLWATKQAANMGRPSMAYAVDAGGLSPSNLRRVRRDASRTDLIVTRTRAATERLRTYGVTAPMESTADTTFTFRMDPGDKGALRRLWPEAGERVAGISPLDFYCWPVVVRPWGRASDRYRWPYYFSRSRERTAATQILAQGLARQADRLVREHDIDVALLCMESLDEPIARQVQSLMVERDRTRIFSSCDHDASVMNGVILDLDFLVSSRYHACVMAMAGGIPMVAVGHDVRTEDLFRDMKLYKDNFIPHRAGGLFDTLEERVEAILADPAPERVKVERAHAEHLERARRNRELLRVFAEERGWTTMA